MDKIIDAISGAVIVLIAGSAIELMGLSSGWTFVIAGAVGGYGTGQVKEWFRAWAEKKVDE
ncbi:Phage holin family (Lysis protein S) [compost metagenome]